MSPVTAATTTVEDNSPETLAPAASAPSSAGERHLETVVCTSTSGIDRDKRILKGGQFFEKFIRFGARYVLDVASLCGEALSREHQGIVTQ